MRFSYDPKANIAYIRFKEKISEVEAIPVSDELVVDMASDGTVYGIELLNASEQLNREDRGSLWVTNSVTGKSIEIPLSF